jgi:putative N6-adenine-specific DNA methylase
VENRFIARGLPEPKRKVGQFPWHNLLLGRGQIQLQVRLNSKKSQLNHKTAIRAWVLEGINESLDKNEPGTSTTYAHASEGSETALPLSVRIENDEAILSLDTSPTPLHRRGYRFETAKAPLREDLAFAMLWSAGWCIRDTEKPQSTLLQYNGFLDPFCGSGTIAIEVASLAAGLPPGRLRSAPLAGTVLYQPKMWRNMLENAKRQATILKAQRQRLKIAASDRDEGAVAAARSNAERAGVQSLIQFNCSAVGSHPWLNSDKTTSSADAGQYPLLVTTNPPFGLRIAADKKAKSRVHPLLPL